MTQFLLDTNHAFEVLQGPNELSRRIARQRDDVFGFCIPVLSELWFMVHNSSRKEENRRTLQANLARFEMWEFDGSAAETFGRVKAELRRSGKNVADVDLQIACVALVNDLTLLSSDKAMANVPGLKLENWMA